MTTRTPQLGSPVANEPAARIQLARQLDAQHIAVTIAIILVLAWVLTTAATSPQIRFNRVADYLFSPEILQGVGVTIALTIVSMIAGTLLGIAAALGQLSRIRAIRWLALGYIGVFRGVPLLVQILFIFNIALLVPRIGIGEFSLDTNQVISPFVAATVSLSLYCGAYMAEIIRGGILSVGAGQFEASSSIGMTRWLAMRRVIIPQSLPAIIPATGNQAILMLKSTAMVVVIGARDLLTQAERIYTTNYLIIELLLVASFWYLLLVSLASIAQRRLERRFSH